MTKVTLAEQIAHADRRIKWLRRCVESDLGYLCDMEAISVEIREMKAVLAALRKASKKHLRKAGERIEV